MAYEGTTPEKAIGRRLGDCRRAAKLSVEDAALRMHISVSALKSHEKGARGVRTKLLAAYARVYGVPPSVIIGDRTTEFAHKGLPHSDVIAALRFTVACLEAHSHLGRKADRAAVEYAKMIISQTEGV